MPARGAPGRGVRPVERAHAVRTCATSWQTPRYLDRREAIAIGRMVVEAAGAMFTRP